MRTFACAAALFFLAATSHAGDSLPAKNIVVVHGAFADGSGWEGVARILTNDGYRVTIVQNSTASLAADVLATQNAIAAQNGPVVLVGHSYGGVVITQAGNDQKVKSLVYVAAFVPDAGESLQSLNANPEPGFVPPPILPPANGFLLLDRAKFAEAFAADVDRDKAAFLASAQVPLGLPAFTDRVTAAAWRTKPSAYVVTTDDRMVPPAAERRMAARAGSTIIEIKASHAVYISQAYRVAKVIEAAARK